MEANEITVKLFAFSMCDTHDDMFLLFSQVQIALFHSVSSPCSSSSHEPPPPCLAPQYSALNEYGVTELVVTRGPAS